MHFPVKRLALLLCLSAGLSTILHGAGPGGPCTAGPVTAYTQSTYPIPVTVTEDMAATGQQITIAGVTTPSGLNNTWTVTHTGQHTGTLTRSGGAGLTGTLSAAGSTVFLYLGSGVTCVESNNIFGTALAATETVTFAPTAGWSVVGFAYICITAACTDVIPDWAANNAYTTTVGSGCTVGGTCIHPSLLNPCHFTYYALGNGTSAASEPTWNTAGSCQSQTGSVTDNGLSWAPIIPVFENQSGTALSCFAWSPSSPALLQTFSTTSDYQNYGMYCPSIPAGVTSLILSCRVNGVERTVCAAMSIMATAYTGMCATAPCIDVDGLATAPSASVTSLSMTTPATKYTNELVLALGSTFNDEALTPSGSCGFIDSGSLEAAAYSNTVNGVIAPSTGFVTCGETWTGGDDAGFLMMTVKTAASGSSTITGAAVSGPVAVKGNARFSPISFTPGSNCPSGANYTNLTTPTGAPVTLSSLGVTNCYYVAANGSDSNDGLSEASGHPWLHVPLMPNCSSSCAAVQNQSGGLPAGTGLIFRGGDTWHFGNSGAAPYTGGVWEFNVSPYPVGTSSHPIYLGVDSTWYTGGSWARPVFTADNSLCNSGDANGTTCISTTDSYGQPSYYVSSCAYQIGSVNDFIDTTSGAYFIFDNFEMTGLCQSSTGQPGHHDEYFSYGSINAPVYFLNLYIHGATHLQFAALNGEPACATGVCTNVFAFEGGSGGGAVFGETVANSVVDFSDSDPGGEGLCFGGFWNVTYNVFHYTTQCLPNPMHTFHDNDYSYFYENGHSNLLEDIGEATGANAIYNNNFAHIEASVTSGGGVFLWLAPPTATTTYVFNNLAYDVGNLEYLNQGGTAGDNAKGNYTFFNNTWQTNVSQPILRCETYTNGTVTDTNNHYIDDGTYILGPCSTLTSTTALAVTNANATTYGYTSGSTFAYAPASSTCNGHPSSADCTIGNGTNEVSGYCAALTTAGLTAAATACQSDTTYACTYNTGNHTVSCPNRTVIARPASAAWDIGAYQF